MGRRQIAPLIFGAGLDRTTGIFSREGRAGYDLRNLYLLRDKAQVRRGFRNVNPALRAWTDGSGQLADIVQVAALSSAGVGVVAGLDQGGGVHLFQVGGDGTGLLALGALYTLSPGSYSPPRLLMAEQYGKMFVAHDEPELLLRQSTRYYDPFGAPQLGTLSADLDGDGVAADIRFRGVSPYGTYLVGWGYGTDTDPDHPEVVRVSDPEDATSFAPDDYFLAGTGGTPVLNCLSAGDPSNPCLVVLKPKQLYRIIGQDRESFGIDPAPVDDGHGLAASRLAYALGGAVYFWDADEGPRRTSGGASQDLAWPLDLNAPSPADLVAEGAVGDGFCCYLPVRRQLLFVFGQRVYCLSLWDASGLKWSYWELGVTAQSGGVLYLNTEEPAAPPTGSAASVVLTTTGNESIHAAWNNTGLTGGEVAELWLHAVTANTWTLAAQAPCSGASQAQDLAVNPGTEYELQIRYRRGPWYGTAYAGGDPSAWPAASISNRVTTAITAPVASAAWSRVSATGTQVVLTWSGSAKLASTVKRGGVAIATVAAGTLAYTDAAAALGAMNAYTVEQDGGDTTAVSATLNVWGGPEAVITVGASSIFNDGSGYPQGENATFTVAGAQPGDVVEAAFQCSGAGPSWFVALTDTVADAETLLAGGGLPISVNYGGPVPVAPASLGAITMRLRVTETEFGVTDAGAAVTTVH